MIAKILLISLVLCAGCSRQISQEEMFKLVWDGDPSTKLIINNVVVGDQAAFAVFAKATRTDFIDLTNRTHQFKVWTPVGAHTTIEIGTKQLVAFKDFSGVYSVGESRNGKTNIAIWDEQKGEIILILATGLM